MPASSKIINGELRMVNGELLGFMAIGFYGFNFRVAFAQAAQVCFDFGLPLRKLRKSVLSSGCLCAGCAGLF
jgi:hypothetical protein